MKYLVLLSLYTLMILPGRQSESPHGSNFNISCSKCHSPKSWKFDPEVYSFDHGSTAFTITGQHRQISCRDCHPTLVFSDAGTECYSCHQDIHQGTVGQDCARCHSTDSWLVTRVSDLHRMSRFPLLGAHRVADCLDCHPYANNARYEVPGIECIDCHRSDYMATTNPNHVLSGIPVDCMHCHSVSAFEWSGKGFNHSFFPLADAHSTPLCSDCHLTNQYSEANPDCASCHLEEFTASMNPEHARAGFSTDCSECHTLKPGWTPATYNHDYFPLTLGHKGPSCSDCHSGGVYQGTSIDCYSCHEQDYIASREPDHAGSGFPVNCMDCHTTNPGWSPASFDHTFFPLTLGHSAALCLDCHKGGNFSTVSPDCYSCHEQDYLSTTDPNHSASGFSHTCTDCHSTQPGWTPVTLDHSFFPLTMGHSGVSCNDCHKGNYSTLSPDCFSCHKPDYESTINPSHTLLGFSTTCLQCHTTSPGWTPATFLQHDSQFPIYSGKHKGEWNSCSDCHTNASNYSVFSCINCHEHNKADMDDEHLGEVSGYSYNSAACYQCHPRGNAD